MTIKDAVLVCYRVLRMQPEAIALAYKLPLPEVNSTILTASRRRTGGFAITPSLDQMHLNGTHKETA